MGSYERGHTKWCNIVWLAGQSANDRPNLGHKYHLAAAWILIEGVSSPRINAQWAMMLSFPTVNLETQHIIRGHTRCRCKKVKCRLEIQSGWAACLILRVIPRVNHKMCVLYALLESCVCCLGCWQHRQSTQLEVTMGPRANIQPRWWSSQAGMHTTCSSRSLC